MRGCRNVMVAACLSVGALLVARVEGAPITEERLERVVEGERAAWKRYLAGSKVAAAKDEGVLAEEVKASGRERALKAPNGGDFKMSQKAGDAWYGSEEALKLAEVILSFQTPSGGWSKHVSYGDGVRKAGMQWSSQYEPGSRPHYPATFDNRATTEQLQFLAYVWHATKDKGDAEGRGEREAVKAGFLRGLEYVLAAQYPNGGWPQVYPLEGKYHDDVTFNDDAMTRVLNVLRGIVAEEAWYGMVSEEQRGRVSKAFEAGVACVLKAQVRVGGERTVWCAQYDPLTLEPASARAMEPATLGALESARILGMLMSIEKPSVEVVAAIESGLKWLEGAKVTGLAKATRDGKGSYEPVAGSTEVYWARFYDLKTGKPVFPGRDGVVYGSFVEMAAGNRLGYDYFGTQPGSLLNVGQKKWRKLVGR